MKTIILSLAVALVAFVGSAKANNVNDLSYDNFVITTTDTVFCENVNVDENKISLTKTNGTKIINTFEDVVMYKKDGKVFKKMPTVINGKVDASRKPVFMELVGHKNNMDLMKVITYESSTNELVSKFYIYENNKFILELSTQNQNFLLNHFLNINN